MRYGLALHKRLPFLVLFSLCACSLFQTKEDTQAVARVHDSYLYYSDIKDITPPGISENDSISMVRNFISNWAKKQLVLNKAELNLTEDKKNVEKLLKDYRNDLVIHVYKQELIKQYLDTAISETEIEEYYGNYASNFELKENILKLRYIKVNKEAPKLDQVKRWCRSSKEEDQQKLQEYCLQFASLYSLDDSSWVSFDELLKTIPIQDRNQEQFLANNTFTVLEDSLSLYFMDIKEYKIVDNISPLEYVRATIRNILINQRKLELINDVENRLLDDALKRKSFEIY